MDIFRAINAARLAVAGIYRRCIASRLRAVIASLLAVGAAGCVNATVPTDKLIDWDRIFGPNQCNGCSALIDQIVEREGAFIAGTSDNVVYGSACTTGFRRVQARAFKLEGPANAVCQDDGADPRTGIPLGWVDDNPSNCRFRVHFGLAGGTKVKCRVVIAERQ
jgi:hypothetical protein